MKKILFAFILSALISAPAFAKCEGGNEYSGNNGHAYCVGPEMAWWAAFTWCKAQDRHVASMLEMCPGWNGNTGRYGICQNLFGNDVFGGKYNYKTMWVSNPSGTDSAYVVGRGSGGYDTVEFVSTAERNATGVRAVCY